MRRLSLEVIEAAEDISCYKAVLGRRNGDKDVAGNFYYSRTGKVLLLLAPRVPIIRLSYYIMNDVFCCKSRTPD